VEKKNRGESGRDIPTAGDVETSKKEGKGDAVQRRKRKYATTKWQEKNEGILKKRIGREKSLYRD